MHAVFLLGPAGSGKTWTCLEQIRESLRHAPLGPPLLFLAPKQATFQLERQLLADPSLPGYSRLRLVSFERLAQSLLEAGEPIRALLDEEGRVMVLRALLARQAPALSVFRATARLPGLARELSLTLRELQRHHAGPERLRRTAERVSDPTLAGKLRDCALLLEHYGQWLHRRGLRDGDTLLDRAADLIRGGQVIPGGRGPGAGPAVAGLWLDGFAEMTPQELDLLAELVPCCERATLAFCLPGDPDAPRPSLSPWALVGRTCSALLARLRQTPGVEVSVECLPRPSQVTRFTGNPTLTFLERSWSRPPVAGGPAAAPDGQIPEAPPPLADRRALRFVACADAEAEAVVAAHEILAHVHAGGRFRDIAVLVRSLDGYHAVLGRTLRRYDIPFFLDRRESVAHHPLAELTRYSLRTLTYHWRYEDWFGALKSGLLPATTEQIDALENEALARGWVGGAWLRPLSFRDPPPMAAELERLRQTLVAPLLQLAGDLGHPGEEGTATTGARLADALGNFWRRLRVESQLERWAQASDCAGDRTPAVHRSVVEQLQGWVDNLRLAFAEESLPLRDWLPILEAGLAGLTVGVVPPALDQVLVGAIDRSRNPDLQLALVLGVNQGVFPAVPAASGLFTESDRDGLEQLGMELGPNRRRRTGHERYFGYIAFTRPAHRLVVTWAERGPADERLQRSPFVDALKRLFPAVAEDRAPQPAAGWVEARHPVELAPAWIAARRAGRTGDPWDVAPAGFGSSAWRGRLEALAAWQPGDTLSPAAARALYGPRLRTSVSALESFAACPFRFFIEHGLCADERRRFEADFRERGSFQHEVLARFHRELQTEGRRWRDLTPGEATERVKQIARSVMAEFREGLFASTPETGLAARAMAGALGECIGASVAWMTTYGFDPQAVELGFGLGPDSLPAWELDLGEGRCLEFRGRVDRVDVADGEHPGERQFVVIDYKSGGAELGELRLSNGLQLQLAAYLAALRGIPEAAERLGAARLVPVGAFYVNLRGQHAPGADRREVLDETGADRRSAYRHQGRFQQEAVALLDRGFPDQNSGQFAYRVTQRGQFHGGDRAPLAPARFTEWLDRTVEQLRSAGRRILQGEIRIDPYRHGREQACDQCPLETICRIDPWTHTFRALKKAAAAGAEEGKP